jgi:type IV secretion system protein VirB1
MDFNALSLECAPWVAPRTMAAIVKTESQFNPLAININGGARLERQPASKKEAVVTAKWLIANNYNIDTRSM